MNISNLSVTHSGLAALLEKTIPAHYPVLIKGAPGIGKTETVLQVAKKLEADLFISHPAVEDVLNYKGLPALVNDHATFLPFGDLERLIVADKLTVCFIDDLGQAAPAVQAAAMQLILGRRVSDHKISDHVVFVAATNRKQDKAGVNGILEPVKSRHHTIVELTVDNQEWLTWAVENNLSSVMISFIRWRPHMLFDFKPTQDITNSPCPRTIKNAADLYTLGLPKEIEYQVYAGAAGEGFAAEFCGFLDIYRDLPSLTMIQMNPETQEVPSNPAVLYALSGALSEFIDNQNVDRMMLYTNRMPPEFQVLIINDLIKKDPKIADTKAFVDWSIKNQHFF